MPVITLPDGSQRTFANPVSIEEIAADIGPGLAKAALGGKIGSNLFDTSHVIEEDTNLSIITERDDEGLDIIRHSSAHLMAQAVKELFPKAQVTIGPVIENGFFYDFSYEESFTPEDLLTIEKKMQELAKQNLKVERSVMTREDAISFFRDMG